MAFLQTLEGVRFRLCGGDRFSVPSLKPIMGDWDRMSPSEALGLEAAARVEAYLSRRSTTNIVGLEVPVHFFDPTGKSYKLVYPCLTFDIIGTQPRYNEFVYQSKTYRGDMYAIPVETSKAIADPGEEDELAPRQVKKRFVEHPLDIMFEIRTYAKDPIVQGLLESYVYTAFEPRDFLRVPMKDGSWRSWDVIFQSSSDLDRRHAVRVGTPGVEREYAKTYTFVVEGYFDNTDTAYLVNLVRERTLAITLP